VVAWTSSCHVRPRTSDYMLGYDMEGGRASDQVLHGLTFLLRSGWIKSRGNEKINALPISMAFLPREEYHELS
jgi:hypothetical protein